MESLFDTPPTPPSRSDHFDGPDYDVKRDGKRLTGQLAMIWQLVKLGHWWTVKGIANITGIPENSVQAQLRNLRKPRYGAYDVQRRRVSESGLYEYRVGEKGAGTPKKAECANCQRLEAIIVDLLK